MNMKVKMKFGLERQAYAAPRAESIELIDEGLLCASVMSIENENFGNESMEEETLGTWGN